MSALRRLSVSLLALVLASSAARGEGPPRKLPDDVFAHPTGDDAVDVVLFGGGRSAVVRVHVRVGAKAFRSSWGDFAVLLYAFLDRDNDGIVTTAEANRAPWTNLLTSPLNGVQALRPAMRPTSIDASPTDGKVTFNELVNYLQGTRNFEPLSPESGAPYDPRSEAVFSQLDRDDDKFITPAELTGTDGIFAKLDRDEDETLSLDEFTPDRSPLADRFGGVIQTGNVFDPSLSPAIPLTSAEVRTAVATRLLGAYGKGTPRKVGMEPLGADARVFTAADSDRDGLLNRDELVRYLESPTTHLELLVTLPSTRAGQGRIEKAPSGVGLLPTRTGTNGAFIVEFAASEIEFLTSETRGNLLNFFQNQFKNADANKDGVINAQEARGNNFLQQIHLVADRDGDGKMTESELTVYIDLSSAAEESRIALTVSDLGIALHDRLDADHDGRLSVRELRGAQSKMASFDADHDGRFALSELPRRTQLNLGRGSLQNRRRVVASRATISNPRVTSKRPTLPAWFVGMDRNHDGDVSPREFLGASDQFRQFDADGDGLIDGNEAARIR